MKINTKLFLALALFLTDLSCLSAVWTLYDSGPSSKPSTTKLEENQSISSPV